MNEGGVELNYLKDGAKVLLIYGVIFILLIFILAFPKNPNITYKGLAETPVITYIFYADVYKNNLKYFYTMLTEYKSLGTTQYEGVMVEDEIREYFPKSVKVIIVAFFTSIILGMLKGIYDYRKRNSRLDFLGQGTTWIMQSIPDFFIMISIQWLALMFIPSLRIFSNSTWYNFIVIGLIVAIYPALYIARITSAALVAEEGGQYIQVARSKGLSEAKVVYKHMLKNAMRTILAHMSPLMVYILSSLIMAEYLFAYEGIAYRMFFSLGIVTKVTAGFELDVFEPAMTLGAAVCFMGTVLTAQFLAFTVRLGLKLDRSVPSE